MVASPGSSSAPAWMRQSSVARNTARLVAVAPVTASTPSRPFASRMRSCSTRAALPPRSGVSPMSAIDTSSTRPPLMEIFTVTSARNPCDDASYVPSFACGAPLSPALPAVPSEQPASVPPTAPAAPTAAVSAAPLMKLRLSMFILITLLLRCDANGPMLGAKGRRFILPKGGFLHRA